MGSNQDCCKNRYDAHFTSAITLKELLDLMIKELQVVDKEIKILEKKNVNTKEKRTYLNNLNEKERFFKIFYVEMDDCIYKLNSKSFTDISVLKDLVSNAFNTLDTLNEQELKKNIINISEFVKENENR